MYLAHICTWILILLIMCMFGKLKGNMIGIIFWGIVFGCLSATVHSFITGG